MKEKVLSDFLSPLESSVMNELFSKKELTTRNIFKNLKKKKVEGALTSVAVSLDRLYAKGLVSRRIESCRGGLRYLYKINGDKEEVYRILIRRSVDRILKSFGPLAASYFNDRFGKG